MAKSTFMFCIFWEESKLMVCKNNALLFGTVWRELRV